MVRKFGGARRDSSKNKGSIHGDTNSYASVHSIKPELEVATQALSARDYEKAANLLDRTLTLGLGINQPNKIRQLNLSVYSSVNDGFHRALKLLHKNSVGNLKTAYGFNENEYETEIAPIYQQIFEAFELFENNKENFNAQTYRTTFEVLLGNIGRAASTTNNDVLSDALKFLKDSFSNGVIAFYEKEGLSNPINIVNFFDDNGCLQYLDNLLPNGIDVDPTNPSHNTLLMVAFDLYLSDLARYNADRNQFNIDLNQALSRFGSEYFPENSDEGMARKSFDDYADKLDSDFEDEESLESDFENSFYFLSTATQELRDLDNIGSHTKDDGNGNDVFHEDYKDILDKARKSASVFRKIESSLTLLVDKLNSDLGFNPPIDISNFIDGQSSVDFKQPDGTNKSITYPNFKFRSKSALRDIYRSLTLGMGAAPALTNFESIESMAMSISRLSVERDFISAGINNPSQKAWDLAASSKIERFNMKSKFRAGVENFGQLSQKLHNIDLPLKTLSYEESLTFAIQDVLKHHPDIDAAVLREACQAHSIEQFDALITKSKRMLSRDVIARLVSTLQVIYSGDFKTLNEDGNECILAISKTGFPRLQRQVGIFMSGYANYKAALALSSIDNTKKTRSQIAKYLLGASNHSLEEMNYTAAIISQGTSYSDTLRQMWQANRNYSDALINSGVSFKEYAKLQRKSGYQIGRFGNYSKLGYRTRRFTRGTTNVIKGTAKGAYNYVLKPVTKATIGIPFKVIDWITGNRISNHSVSAWNYISGKKK